MIRFNIWGLSSMMFYHIRCITLLICSCLTLNVFAAQSEYRLLTELQAVTAQKNAAEKVDQYLARWASTTLPGLAVAVVKDGELVYSKGVGLANLEYGIPITPDTVFEVASISKQFTAFSILLLADEGKLSIDDEVTKYLPELSDLGHKITLRHLLHHTSGLRQQGVLLELAGWQSDDIATQAQALKLLSMQKDLNFTPGEMFEYSNSGYFLLAEIVSRVSGQSFAEFTQNRISNRWE
ncbi:serine hydrolase [Rheinheimera baltica]|nr:serine hydrolase [Rheinheimera baltica]MDP5190089.1 serine hydrolase [Rheinheimera baltica]